MREDRQTAPRRPRLLVARPVARVEAFDLADKIIVVDGVEMRLGDFWAYARYDADMSRGCRHVG